jgi:hypothetical protein
MSGSSFSSVGAAAVVVSTGGFDGLTWIGSTQYASYSFDRGTGVGGNPVPLGLASSHVKPTTPNGYVYRCTKTGTSAAPGSEPTWPTTIGVEARTYAAGIIVVVGDYIRPTTPNSHIYQVTAISGGFTSWRLSGSEPTWTTTNGNTNTDGIITLTCAADPTTSWVADGGVIWTCIGTEATYSLWGPGPSGANNRNYTSKAVGHDAGTTLQTTNATATPVPSIGIFPFDRMPYLVTVKYIANKVGTSDSAAVIEAYKVESAAGVFTISAVTTLMSKIDAALAGIATALAFDAGSGTACPLVTGLGATNIDWFVKVEYEELLSS